jgi:hypothetical protein
MKYADNWVPMATSQIDARCSFGGNRSQPKIHSPRNVDSRKEGQQALDRQRGAEDVADELRVGTPIHPELELLHDAGHDTHREVDQEQLAPELSHPPVLQLTRPVPGGVQSGDQGREPDRDRHEQEVIDGGDPELPPRQINRIHAPNNPGRPALLPSAEGPLRPGPEAHP